MIDLQAANYVGSTVRTSNSLRAGGQGDLTNCARLRVRLGDLVDYLIRQGWVERRVDHQGIRCFISPGDMIDDEGKAICLRVPASEAFSDYDQRIVETLDTLSKLYELPIEAIVNSVIDEEARLRCFVDDMSRGREATEQLFRATVGSIRKGIAKAIFDPSQRQQEEEDLCADAFRRFLERLQTIRVNKHPIKLQAYFLGKQAAYDWRRRQSREAVVAPADFDLIVQESVDERSWPDFEQDYRSRQGSQQQADEDLAVLGLKYVEDEKLVRSARMNLVYASAVAVSSDSGVRAKLSQQDLTRELPNYRSEIEQVFEAVGNIRLSGTSLSYEATLDALWAKLDVSQDSLPGFSPWRKTLLYRVGATPKQPQLNLSGTIVDVANREQRRLFGFLERAKSLLIEKI